jgi:hypothetical protein
MIKLLQIIIMLLCMMISTTVEASSGKRHSHYPNQGGHYAYGQGKAHKHGEYKNPRTGNHYKHHI